MQKPLKASCRQNVRYKGSRRPDEISMCLEYIKKIECCLPSSIAIQKFSARKREKNLFRLPRPQKNFMEVPNIVFDEVIPRITNLSALKCYLLIIRKTWGYSKTGDWISISQLIILTGLSKPSVITGMAWLESEGYLWSAQFGKLGNIKKMYFLCSEETEEVEQMYKTNMISSEKLYEIMMEERKS